MNLTITELVQRARAVADPNRLRILLICREKSLNVGEMSAILRLSDPLVSHHLKVLAEADLVRRTRAGKQSLYASAADAPANTWLRALLESVDTRDAVVAQDRSELSRRLARGSTTVETRAVVDRLDRALGEFSAERVELLGLAAKPRVCVESDRFALCAALAARASTAVLVGSSAAAATRLRREVRSLQSVGEIAVVTRRSLAPEASFDLALLDCTNRAVPIDIAAALADASSRIVPGGSLLLFVPYDALAGDEASEHPLLRLRRTLSQHGLRCDHIQPIETRTGHVLAAAATLRADRARRVA
jgi:ArsR family transcriptional regulator